MLLVIVGKEYKKVKAEADKKASDFLKSHAGAAIEKHTAESITVSDLEYRAVGNFLFGGEAAYVVQDFISRFSEEWLRIAPSLAASRNLFIFSEDELSKDLQRSVADAGGEIHLLKAEEKEWNNPFAVTDALILRDKKTAWKLYRQEIDRGEDANAILGRFLWAMKTLNLIKRHEKETAAMLGISPFVFNKAKSAAKKWTTDEAENFYADLLFGLPYGGEIEYHTEKLILERL